MTKELDEEAFMQKYQELMQRSVNRNFNNRKDTLAQKMSEQIPQSGANQIPFHKGSKNSQDISFNRKTVQKPYQHSVNITRYPPSDSQLPYSQERFI